MKNLKILIFSVLLCISFACPIFATSDHLLIVDYADKISDSAEEGLLQKAEDIRRKYKFDVVIVTVNSTDGMDVEKFAETLYLEIGYGQGELNDGMMLLLSMEDRDYVLFKKGRISDNLPKNLEESILDPTVEKLRDDDYDGAFNTFLSKVDEVYSKEKSDGSFQKEPKGIIPYLVGIAGSFLIAFIIVQTGAGSLKSVRFSRTANSYVKQNSVVIAEGLDKFLYRNVTRREKPKPKDSSGGRTSGSGSSSHSSYTKGKF